MVIIAPEGRGLGWDRRNPYRAMVGRRSGSNLSHRGKVSDDGVHLRTVRIGVSTMGLLGCGTRIDVAPSPGPHEPMPTFQSGECKLAVFSRTDLRCGAGHSATLGAYAPSARHNAPTTAP